MATPSTRETANAPDRGASAPGELQAELYAGPVPHPDILAQLNSVLPGAAERIFRMAEKDQEQTIAMQKGALELKFQNVRNAHRERSLAQWLAFVVCVLFLGCGTWLVMEGHDWAGSIMLGGTLASIVASFLLANTRKKK